MYQNTHDKGKRNEASHFQTNRKDPMKTWDKAKFTSLGLFAGAVLLPLAIGAQETIRVTFKEGDVISASVMNSVFQQLDNATNSITSDDLVGTWSITQVVPYNGQPGNGTCRLSNSCEISGTTDAADGLSRSRADVVTIAKSGTAYTYSQATVSSFTNAHTNTPDAGNLSVLAETAIFKNGSGNFNYFYAKKKSSTRIVLQDIQSGAGAFNMVILNKRNTAPLPPNDLTASVSGSSVALAWTDQSSDETGFKVQRKTSATGNWTTVTTTAANVTTYTDAAAAGVYWYRVIAMNAHGDSISSSEIQVVVG